MSLVTNTLVRILLWSVYVTGNHYTGYRILLFLEAIKKRLYLCVGGGGEQGSSATAQTEDRGKGVSFRPPHLQIVSYLTNTTFLLLVYGSAYSVN